MSAAPYPEDFATILDILEQMPKWRIDPVRWPIVSELLGAIDEALSAGDLAAIRGLTRGLERAGPIRSTRIGSEPTEPPPPDLLERRNHLVHRLTRQSQTPPSPPREPGDRSGAGDDQPNR